MSQYNACNDDQDHYAVLGVTPSSDEREIRKAYLKLSLEHHPDKNPDDPDAAQAAFVCIGQAYQVLSDPVQRAAYDVEYRRRGGFYASAKNSGASAPPSGAGFASGFHSTNTGSSSHYAYQTNMPQNQQYASYKDTFEATMADLSEDELRDMSGAAAMLGGVVGAILGSRLFKDHPILREVGPTIASAVASQAAATVVRTAHTQSKQKALALHDKRERMARGEPVMDDGPPTNTMGEHIKEIIKDMVQQGAKEVGKSIQQAAIDMMAKNGKRRARNKEGYQSHHDTNTSVYRNWLHAYRVVIE